MRFLFVVPVALVAVIAVGCQGSCPYPGTSPIVVTPETSCLQTSMTSCVAPTLRIVNNCPDALYMPIAYGNFGPDAGAGADVEVVPGATINFDVRSDKATSSTKARAEFSVPARLGANPITLTFFVTN
ncbi:MAG: hypothetical protein ABIP39_00780 [Polyangiaceae bacterium]